MRRRIFYYAILCLLGAGPTSAQDAGYHLVHVEASPPAKGTGAFGSVCIDHVDGLVVLQQRAGELRWGTGVNQTFAAAAEGLPFFGMPVLVTTECLEQLTSQYTAYYQRSDLVVRDLN